MQRQVTIKDIAQRVKFSNATVSAILGEKRHCYASEKTKSLIRATAKEMGYVPNLVARGLKSGKTYTIGLIESAIQNTIKQQEIVIFTNLLGARNYRLYTSYFKGEDKLLKDGCQDLLARGCDALIISGWLSKESCDFVESITNKAVLLNSNRQTGIEGRTIYYDFESGVSEAMSYLLELGHRDIIMFGGKWKQFYEDQRPVTFLRIQRKHQPCLDDSKLIHVFPKSDHVTANAMKVFLQENPSCTALLCTSDLIAMKVIQSCAELGLSVPRDLSVVGFDDIESSTCFNPALTTLRQPLEESAEQVFKLLMNILENENNRINTVLKATLQIRKTVGPPRKREVLC